MIALEKSGKFVKVSRCETLQFDQTVREDQLLDPDVSHFAEGTNNEDAV